MVSVNCKTNSSTHASIGCVYLANSPVTSTPTVARGVMLGDSKASKLAEFILVLLLPLSSLLLKYRVTCVEYMWVCHVYMCLWVGTCTSGTKQCPDPAIRRAPSKLSLASLRSSESGTFS